MFLCLSAFRVPTEACKSESEAFKLRSACVLASGSQAGSAWHALSIVAAGAGHANVYGPNRAAL